MDSAAITVMVPRKPKTDVVVFPVPSGFIPPEGVEPGQSFEALARFQFLKGKMILEAVEGHEVHLEPVATPKSEATTFENAVNSGLDQPV
jgi:hypothetical protein